MEMEHREMEVDEHSEGNTGANNKVTVSTTLTLKYCTTEELGIGFIGTTVFKGKLEGKWEEDNGKEGKNVAAKQYSNHLLQWLENDVVSLNNAEGHNVVRYICTLTNNENKAMSDFRYLTMELCDATLRDWTQPEKYDKGKSVQGIKDLDILSQCVSGLMFIHEMGLAHGNLRPSNILLLKESENNVVVKISDFGLKIKNDHQDMSFNPDSPPGYLGWRPREFWAIRALVNRDEKFQAEIKSDIFSLGCIFYYVITKGQHPFGDINQPSRLPINIELGTFNNLICQTFPQYESRGLPNLIKLMIDCLPEKRPPLEIVKTHPVFWETDKIFRFFGQINTFRWDTRAIIEKVFEQFVYLANEKNVLENEWIGPANIRFNHDFSDSGQNKGVEYTESVQDLIRAIRNYGDEGHKNDCTTPIKIRFSTSIECINRWLDLCPKLLPCAWISFKSLHAAGYSELNKFYGQWIEEEDWLTFDGQKCVLSSVCKQLA